jgi:hypothetical protein
MADSTNRQHSLIFNIFCIFSFFIFVYSFLKNSLGVDAWLTTDFPPKRLYDRKQPYTRLHGNTPRKTGNLRVIFSGLLTIWFTVEITFACYKRWAG